MTRSRVVLGVGGGIAAYKVAALLRQFTERGHDVRVVPTAAALAFVGEPTWAALSGHPVHTDVWASAHEVPHVRLGREADLVVVAPATADLLARAAHGLADDLLTNVLLTARCPVLMAPAMHTEMWLHPATRANVALLRERGVLVLEPDSGRLTGADTGPGRLPEPEAIAAAALALLREDGRPGRSPGARLGRRHPGGAGPGPLPGQPLQRPAGRGAGRRGRRPGRVGDPGRGPPGGARAGRRRSGPGDQRAAVARRGARRVGPGADVVVMAAAVADFRPAEVADHKIKKSGDDGAPTITLVRNPDVLAELGRRRRPGQVLVGFAAETGDGSGDVLAHARRKLAAKGCDLLVVNDVSGGKVFGRADTEVVLLHAGGEVTPLPPGSKTEVAEAIWDATAAILPKLPPSR